MPRRTSPQLLSPLTGCILARNEAHRLEEAIRCLRRFCRRVIVIDNGSTDGTRELAERLADLVIDAPAHSYNFDALRNLALAHVDTDWIFYLDADERVSEQLAERILDWVQNRSAGYAALIIPFKNFFCGKWMEHSGWWPGYTRPQLLRVGKFRYNERLHSGVDIDGKIDAFPPDPDWAIDHFSYPSYESYVRKLAGYTSGESLALVADGKSHSWQAHLAHHVHDWHVYYDRNRGYLDGKHGFILAFSSGFYRFAALAKAWDERRQQGDFDPNEPVPGSVREMLQFMLHVLDHGAEPYLNQPHISPATLQPSHSHTLSLLIQGPVFSKSGFGDELRQFALALIDAKIDFGLVVEDWRDDDPGLSASVRTQLEERIVPPGTSAEIGITHTLALGQRRLQNVRFQIARTMFETDRLPAGVVNELNKMDRIWVAGDFNRESFTRSGINPDLLAIIPGCLDISDFANPDLTPLDLNRFAICNFQFSICNSDPLNPDPDPATAQSAITNQHSPISTSGSVSATLNPDPNPNPNPNPHPDPDPDPTTAQSAITNQHSSITNSGSVSATLNPDPDPNPDPATAQSAITNQHSPISNSDPLNPDPDPPLFIYLSVFDWTLHKGWDVLIEAFAREFLTPDAQRLTPILLLKVWSTNGYTLDDIKAQADAHLRAKLGKGLTDFPNIVFWQETLSVEDLPRLYRSVNAFALPTRGEGCCRPLMEAMASALPTIATEWSGLTAFHNSRAGYPLKHRLVPVSDAGAAEIPPYTGHCWAEPDLAHLRQLLRRVLQRPEEAARKGQAAQKLIRTRFSRTALTKHLASELETCRRLAEQKTPGSTDAGSESPESRRDFVGVAGRLSAPGGQPPPARPSAARTPAVPLAAREPQWPSWRLLWREPPPEVDFKRSLRRHLRVLIEGDQSIHSSLAIVNRGIALGLLEPGDVELSLRWIDKPYPQLSDRDDPRYGPLFALRDAPLSGTPDIVFRHHFPPNWLRPAAGKLIVMQPWEYAHLPLEWVEGAMQADEVWAYSRFVRDIYVRSGVPPEKIRIVPLAFDPLHFPVEGPGFPLNTDKKTRFLYVGGALDRKGADLALGEYLRAFRRSDDVCLIAKVMGTKTFYPGERLCESFRRAAADKNGPEVHFFEDDLSFDEMAALYRSATCLVHPYRGEGFALPPLEAAAMGVPSIVTAGGPTDDYLDDTSAYRLPYRRRMHGSNQLDHFHCAGDPWQLDPDPAELARAMQSVVRHPEDARARGLAAQERIRKDWTWSASVAEIRHRMAQLVCPEPPAPLVPAIPWNPKKAR